MVLLSHKTIHSAITGSLTQTRAARVGGLCDRRRGFSRQPAPHTMRALCTPISPAPTRMPLSDGSPSPFTIHGEPDGPVPGVRGWGLTRLTWRTPTLAPDFDIILVTIPLAHGFPTLAPNGHEVLAPPGPLHGLAALAPDLDIVTRTIL